MTGRLRFIFLLFFLSFFAISCRLFYWQVVKADELAYLGKSQYGAYVRVSSQRGDIQTSDGFPIATSKLSYLVYANPKEIKNKSLIVQTLSSALQVDKASISAVLDLDKLWVPVASGIDNEKKTTIEAYRLPGVGFEEEAARFYPEASMAAHLLGFVGKNELGEQKGYFGLEGYYDRQLRGKAGVSIQIRDALGRPIVSQMNDTTTAVNGRKLILNIDRSIQYIAEKELKEGIEKYGAEGGMIGIIEPRTGNVLAMVSFPSFDPQKYHEYSDTLYKNPFISNLYEPGSTFKALVMGAALDAKVVKPETKCPVCNGPLSLGGYEIRTWNNTYYKDINMNGVIQHSDNIGMVYVQQMLGIEKMLFYLYRFGIGETTGIDLQGEVAPILKAKHQWYPIDIATASFGQGITVTPIELLTAFASIANEGKRMEPHVVGKIETQDKKTITIFPKVVEKPISSTTAKAMTEILVNAVDGGEAKFAKPKGYRIAGKTGTAQIPIAGHYDPNKTIASFIGFAPADDPKFAMLVIVDRPTTSIYGSETAAPIFFAVTKEILSYYGIAPSE